jgi:ABC-type branched-subunit amino acid transport system substrate-binding protein
MISALNHQRRLSGNKISFVIAIAILLASCSPKIQPVIVKKPTAITPQTSVVKPVEKARFTEASIALLMPFRLNEVNPKLATKAQIERSAMAIDFYQGFKMGIDSAASAGLNFKLNVYDTQDRPAALDNLLRSGALLKSNLVVGPAFPDGLQHLKAYSMANGIPVVSPLAASHPKDFNNPNLISIVNNIDLHAQRIVDYISRSYNRENSIVVLINPKGATEEIFAAPLRKYLQTAKNNRFVMQEYASVFSLETKLVKGKKYIVLLTSYDKKYVTESINKILKLQRLGMNVDLYGHPNWVKQNYNADKLQQLNTIVSASYFVNYKSTPVIAFVKKYRRAYNFEPGEYAFKGFDIGYFFGMQLSAHGREFYSHLVGEKYTGLQNSFAFTFDPKSGYINTSLMLLKFKNYALNVIE